MVTIKIEAERIQVQSIISHVTASEAHSVNFRCIILVRGEEDRRVNTVEQKRHGKCSSYDAYFQTFSLF